MILHVGPTPHNRGAGAARRRGAGRLPGVGNAVCLGLVLMFSAACSGARVEAARFDAARVIADAEAQCAFGPRVPGTEAHRRTRDWLAARLESAGLVVEIQPFDAVLPMTGEAVEGWNLWAAPPAFAPGDAVLLSAHWDTRPYADEEPETLGRQPFPGANDGAASAAFVIEMVRAARGTPLEGRLAIALFDVEDAGVAGEMDSWCLGSQHAARNVPDWMGRIALGINIDMIAHRDVRLRKEGYSLESAPGAVDRLWRIGRDLAPSVFVNQSRSPVMDDHVPFIREGYAYIDLIGLPNPHWHRLSDRPEQLDGASIDALGRVLTEFLREEFARGPERAGKPGID